MNTYIHTYIHTYIYEYIHTYIHTYIQTMMTVAFALENEIPNTTVRHHAVTNCPEDFEMKRTLMHIVAQLGANIAQTNKQTQSSQNGILYINNKDAGSNPDQSKTSDSGIGTHIQHSNSTTVQGRGTTAASTNLSDTSRDRNSSNSPAVVIPDKSECQMRIAEHPYFVPGMVMYLDERFADHPARKKFTKQQERLLQVCVCVCV